MNKRQSLTLMELAVMLLVFGLAAALCMRCFARLELENREMICRDRGVVQLQNAAEVLRQCKGDFPEAAARAGGNWDGCRWTLTFEDYQIQAQPEDIGVPCLGGAKLSVIYQGEVLISMNLRWQEVVYEA